MLASSGASFPPFNKKPVLIQPKYYEQNLRLVKNMTRAPTEAREVKVQARSGHQAVQPSPSTAFQGSKAS